MVTEASKRKPRIGDAQLQCMESLNGDGKSWTYGGLNGWLWNTPSGTKRILDTLVKAGFVLRNNKTYTLSTEGKQYLSSLSTK